MRATWPRLVGWFGLIAVFSVQVVLGQDIRFDAFAGGDPAQKGEAVISGGALSKEAATAISGGTASNPFLPEEAAPKALPDLSTPALGGGPAAGCPVESTACGDLCSECSPVLGCEDCPRVGAVLFSGVESFRGISDWTHQNNAGVVFGGNFGVPLPKLKEYGVGAQFGASYGAYDLDGRATPDEHLTDVQQQIFFTAGLFRRAPQGSRFSAGVAYDWMVNDSFGYYATSPFLGQWRAQIGYALSSCNEIGFWGTLRDRNDHKEVRDGLLTFQPVDQLNFFWHHNFESGADSWLWIGVPELEKAGGDGSLGDMTIGMTFSVPLTERLALYANGQYMRPSAAAGFFGSAENSYTISFGLAFYPGCARTRSVTGNCWVPYLPLANNGNFMVDSNIGP